MMSVSDGDYQGNDSEYLVLQKKSDGAPYIHKIKKKERCVFHNFWQ
jgi:hypothetical protein